MKGGLNMRRLLVLALVAAGMTTAVVAQESTVRKLTPAEQAQLDTDNKGRATPMTAEQWLARRRGGDQAQRKAGSLRRRRRTRVISRVCGSYPAATSTAAGKRGRTLPSRPKRPRTTQHTDRCGGQGCRADRRGEPVLPARRAAPELRALSDPLCLRAGQDPDDA